MFAQLALVGGDFLKDHMCEDLPVVGHVLALTQWVAVVGGQPEARAF